MSDAAIDAAKLQQAKAVVTTALSTSTSPTTKTALEQDDLLSIHVAIVEAADAAWLEAQLKNPQLDKDARLTVALQTRGPMRKPLLLALGAPAFLWR